LGRDCLNDTVMYHNHPIVSCLIPVVRVVTICMIKFCIMKHWLIHLQNEFFLRSVKFQLVID